MYLCSVGEEGQRGNVRTTLRSAKSDTIRSKFRLVKIALCIECVFVWSCQNTKPAFVVRTLKKT